MADPTKGSEEVKEAFCKQCNNDLGRKVLAKAFCEDCEEFLCPTCLRYHNNYKPDHFVFSDSSFLKFDTEYCSSHKTRSLKFYCKTCDVLSCVDCRKEKHLDCNSVVHLTKVIDGLEDDEVNEESYVKAVQAATDTIRQNVEECLSHGTHWKRMVQAELKTNTDQINMTFDQLEGDVENVYVPDKHDLETNLQAVKIIEQYTATYQLGSKKKRTKGAGFNHFIFQKKVQEQLKQLSEETKDLAQVKRTQVYSRKLSGFKPDEITDVTGLENINLKHTNQVPEYKMGVNIRETQPTGIGLFCIKLFQNILLELFCFTVSVVLLLQPLPYDRYRRTDIFDILVCIGTGMVLSLLCKILLQFKCTTVVLSFCWAFVLLVLNIIPIIVSGFLIFISKNVNKTAVLGSSLTMIFAFGFAVVTKIGLFFCLLALILHSLGFWLYQVYVISRWYVRSVRWVDDGRHYYQSVTESFDGPALVVVIWWIICITLAYFVIIVIASFGLRYIETRFYKRTCFSWKRSKTPFSEMYHQMFNFIQKH